MASAIWMAELLNSAFDARLTCELIMLLRYPETWKGLLGEDSMHMPLIMVAFGDGIRQSARVWRSTLTTMDCYWLTLIEWHEEIAYQAGLATLHKDTLGDAVVPKEWWKETALKYIKTKLRLRPVFVFGLVSEVLLLVGLSASALQPRLAGKDCSSSVNIL
jgi:hypothetical protein